MIEICRLTKRQVEPSKHKLPKQLEQVKVFAKTVGHGIGTIDFVEKIAEMKEDEYLNTVKKCGPYAQFKLGNLSRYFEIEIFPEHLKKLESQMPESNLRKLLFSLKDGYLVIRKRI